MFKKKSSYIRVQVKGEKRRQNKPSNKKG